MIVGGALAVGSVCAPPAPAGACSCIGDSVEGLTLELESVTRDGAPVTDLSPWRGWEVGVLPSREGRQLDFGATRTRDLAHFREAYAPAP